MKKIALQIFGFLCLISTLTFSQTYSSGLVNIVGNLDGQIDINTNTDIVTLTLIGPDAGWLAMAFDAFEAHGGADLVMFDGTNLQDRKFTFGFNEPTVDPGGQNWTVTSNTTASGFRTVVGTRARVSPDGNDYMFSATPTTLDVAGAYNANFTMSNKHDEKNLTTLNFYVLGIDDLNRINFSMSPNPATSNLKVVLPSNLQNASIEIFDMLARKIFDGTMDNSHFSIIDVSGWNSGVYLVKVSDGGSTQTKRFVKK